jgi:hypothetical protein
VFRWRDFQQTRAAVLSDIRLKLNELPEEPYPQAMWNQKVDSVWQFVLSRYPGPEAAGAACIDGEQQRSRGFRGTYPGGARRRSRTPSQASWDPCRRKTV